MSTEMSDYGTMTVATRCGKRHILPRHAVGDVLKTFSICGILGKWDWVLPRVGGSDEDICNRCLRKIGETRKAEELV
jgi:hypothetical protein